MKAKKIIGMLTAMSMAMPVLCISPTSADSKGTMRDMTTAEIVEDMGIGINLGNTLESCGDWIAQWSDGSVHAYETAWGSPDVTKEMIQGMADEGFGVLRIPVAWSNRMVDDGTYTIDSEWMARVTEVVDWTLETNMYAIVNIHWDNGWVNKFPENKDESMKRFQVMWEQISDNFKDYGDHLIFEAQNEELGWDSMWNKWGGPSDKEGSFALANAVNQKFVDTVRKSGGNNAQRHLLISGYNTDFEATCDPLFKMPDDPANRMAISVHYYTPASFAILEEDADWAKATSTWGTDSDVKELNGWMDMMKQNYADKGIPVIIGEYGCPTKNKEPESVRKFLSSVCRSAYERGLCPVLWSTPDAHYDRKTFKLADQQLKAEYDKITGGKKPAEVSEPVKETTATTEATTTTTETTTTTTESTTTATETTTVASTSETVTTTTETTTVTTEITTVTSTELKEIVWGDANCDGSVDLSDSVLIMQSLANPDKYSVGKPDGITAQGALNGDVYENGTGITSSDALSIQKFKLNLITELPESYK